MRKTIVLFDSNVGFAGFPLALLNLVSLIDTTKYNVRIVAKRGEPDYEKTIMEACAGAICFGVTSIIGPPVKHAMRISAAVKKAYPDLPIIWGGWLPITLPQQCLEKPYVDYVCTGQGERTFKEFIDMLESGQLSDRAHLLDLGYKVDGKPVCNPRRTPENINTFPDFDVNLIEWDKYMQATAYGRRGLSMHTSFGCPWRCGFCCEEHYCKRKWSGLTAERVVAFMKKVRTKIEFDHLMFFDTNFFVNEERVAAICTLMLKEGLAMPMIGNNGRSNELSRYKPETWRLMQEAGIKSIFIGVEAANDETLKLITKDSTHAQTLDVCRKCAKYGIRPILSMAIGWDAESYTREGSDKAFAREFKEVTSFLSEVYTEITPSFNAYVYRYSPLPCTRLYDMAIKFGYQQPTSLEGWAEFDTHDCHAPWLEFNWWNRTKLFCLRNVIHKLGQEYMSFVDMLPPVFRFPAAAMVGAIMPLARFRMKHQFMVLPIEFYLFEKIEGLFRALNRRKRMINLHD